MSIFLTGTRQGDPNMLHYDELCERYNVKQLYVLENICATFVVSTRYIQWTR